MSNDKTNEFLGQAIRLRADADPDKKAADYTRMSQAEVQKVMHEFQVRQSELELQIKELQKSHLQLNGTLNQYKNVYDCAPMGFITLDTHGYITNANITICELFDLSKIQLLGTKLTKYMYAKENPRFHLFFKQLFNSADRQKIEFKVKRQNRGASTIACHGCSHTNGDKNEVLLMLQDISDQKKAVHAIHQLNKQLQLKINAQNAQLLFKNEKLQDSINEINYSKQQLSIREAKLVSIFNATIEGIVTINDQGIIKSVNKAMATIFGYQADELIGFNVSKLMPASIRKQQSHFIQNYLATHQSQAIGVTNQFEGKKKDGTLIPIDISISEYKIDDASFFIGVIRDVSERKNKELEERQHLDQLAHVSRLGLMGEMAAGIAHEVNQPLTAIATYSQVCLRMLTAADFDPVKLQETLEKTEKQACRAGRIIARMREFISSKRLHRSSVDIHDLIRNAMDLASDECQQFSIDCSLDLIDSPPYISVDEIQIEQVLLNLIKNSIDCLAKMPEGKRRKLSIQTYLNDSKQLETRVKDNGQGIKIKQQAKIFSPFFTTKDAGMGMGLGLSICQSLITSHGGYMRFNSVEGKGTTFYFSLPTIET